MSTEKQYKINDINKLLDSIASCDKSIYDILSDTNPSLFRYDIKIEGDPYQGNIPGELIQGLSNYQTALFRAYSLLITGKSDLRGLEKENLWLSFNVRSGCTEISAIIPQILKVLEKFSSNLTKNQISAIILFTFLAFTIQQFCDCSKSKHEEETKQSEVEANKEIQLKIYETLKDAILKSNPHLNPEIFPEIIKCADEACASVIMHAKGANKITIRNKTYSKDEIQIIQSPEAQVVQKSFPKGTFQIVQTNTENPDLCRIILKDSSGAKIKASFLVAELFEDDVAMVKKFLDYQRDKIWLNVELAAYTRGSSTTYTVLAISPTKN